MQIFYCNLTLVLYCLWSLQTSGTYAQIPTSVSKRDFSIPSLMKNRHSFLWFVHLMVIFLGMLLTPTQGTLLSIGMFSSLQIHFATTCRFSYSLFSLIGLGTQLNSLQMHSKHAIQFALHGNMYGFLKMSRQIGNFKFKMSIL